MKFNLKKIFAFTVCSVGLINASHGGSSFGGAMVGGMAGSMLGSAMTQPRREKTVIVQTAGGEISRNEIARLEQNLRDEITRLESIVRSDLNKLYDRLRESEAKVRDLEDQLAVSRKTKVEYVAPAKKAKEPVDIEPIEEMQELEME